MATKVIPPPDVTGVAGDDTFIDYATGTPRERRLCLSGPHAIMFTYRRTDRTTCELLMFMDNYSDSAREQAELSGRFSKGIAAVEKRARAYGCERLFVKPYDYTDSGYRVKSYADIFATAGYARTWRSVWADWVGDLTYEDEMYKNLKE